MSHTCIALKRLNDNCFNYLVTPVTLVFPHGANFRRGVDYRLRVKRFTIYDQYIVICRKRQKVDTHIQWVFDWYQYRWSWMTMNDLNGGTKTVRLSSCAAVSVGSSCLAGWRRHVLLWVQLLYSVVVVADFVSDVERLGVRALPILCSPRLGEDFKRDTLAALRFHCCSWAVQFIRFYLVTGLLRIPAGI